MEGGILSQLMLLDVGARKFVANCFLLLQPEELKACRLVSTTWDQFILKEVWESPSGRKKLREKLVGMWKTAEPLTEELDQPRQGVNSLFCDDRHVFCGQTDGKVGVYKLSDGQWVADLTPGVRPNNSYFALFTLVAGGDGVLASVAWRSTVTVWSTNTSPMEQLHCFSTDSFHLLDASTNFQQLPDCRPARVEHVQVIDRSKIAISVKHSQPSGPFLASLVVMKKGESVWENQNLASFAQVSQFDKNFLSSDSDWLAFLDTSATEKMRVTLWRGDENGQEIVIPGCEGLDVVTMSMELPYLMLSLHHKDRRKNLINVYRVTADNLEKVNANASLVKSIGIKGYPTHIISKSA